jgi:hypothetical protein
VPKVRVPLSHLDCQPAGLTPAANKAFGEAYGKSADKIEAYLHSRSEAELQALRDTAEGGSIWLGESMLPFRIQVLLARALPPNPNIQPDPYFQPQPPVPSSLVFSRLSSRFSCLILDPHPRPSPSTPHHPPIPSQVPLELFAPDMKRYPLVLRPTRWTAGCRARVRLHPLSRKPATGAVTAVTNVGTSDDFVLTVTVDNDEARTFAVRGTRGSSTGLSVYATPSAATWQLYRHGFREVIKHDDGDRIR